MALQIKTIPILTDNTARLFDKMAKENFNSRDRINFSNQVKTMASILSKAKI